MIIDWCAIICRSSTDDWYCSIPRSRRSCDRDEWSRRRLPGERGAVLSRRLCEILMKSLKHHHQQRSQNRTSPRKRKQLTNHRNQNRRAHRTIQQVLSHIMILDRKRLLSRSEKLLRVLPNESHKTLLNESHRIQQNGLHKSQLRKHHRAQPEKPHKAQPR